MENNFKGCALNAVVIVKQIDSVNETAGGLDISSAVDKNEKYREGIVVSIGELAPKNKDGEPYVKVGDTVVWDNYKATPFTQDGIEYKSCYYSDLFLKK